MCLPRIFPARVFFSQRSSYHCLQLCTSRCCCCSCHVGQTASRFRRGLRQAAPSSCQLVYRCGHNTLIFANLAPYQNLVFKPRNRRKVSYKKDWTFEDLVRYFGGNRVDAASQVCDKTIRYCLSSPNKAKYPLTPLNSPCSSPSVATPGSNR